MDIIITDWALQTYLDLKHKNTFTSEEYKNIICPDVILLKEGFHLKDAKVSEWEVLVSGNVC